MSKFHINQVTGRYNICRATVEECPLKGADGKSVPHFATKEEAKRFIESDAKAANPEVLSTTLKKTLVVEAPTPEAAVEASNSVESASNDEPNVSVLIAAQAREEKARVKASMILHLSITNNDAFTVDHFEDYLDENEQFAFGLSVGVKDDYNDGLDDYDYDNDGWNRYSDYDDKIEYTDQVIIDPKSMARGVFFKETGKRASSKEDEAAVNVIHKILKDHDMFSDYNYSVEESRDWDYPNVTCHGDSYGAIQELREIFEKTM